MVKLDSVAQRLDSRGAPARAVQLAVELQPHYSAGELLAILGNVYKETGFTRLEENLDYSRTPPARIRLVFGARMAGLTDAQIASITRSPEAFANLVYGGEFGVRSLGNTLLGDGWRFRGMGDIQLTGRGNYTAASRAIYGDDRLVRNPEMVKDVPVSARVMRWYFAARVPAMARRLGIVIEKADQRALNLLYTSAVAGLPLNRSTGYGAELVRKVDEWVARMG